MTTFANTAVHDALLDKIATGNALHVCIGHPTDRADAITRSCATSALAGGDYTKAAGAPSGRKVTIGAKAGLTAIYRGI